MRNNGAIRQAGAAMAAAGAHGIISTKWSVARILAAWRHGTAGTAVALNAALLRKLPDRGQAGDNLISVAEAAFRLGAIDQHDYHEVQQFNKCNNIVKHKHYFPPEEATTKRRCRKRSAVAEQEAPQAFWHRQGGEPSQEQQEQPIDRHKVRRLFGSPDAPDAPPIR
jgi:hypothetical protein